LARCARSSAILEPTGIMDAQAFVHETYAEFLLRQSRGTDARVELQAARKFHYDRLAFRNRARIDALIERSQVSP
jgi:hypothetical protein